eukprot:1088169-Pyramimonas_sp.AAC.1
MKRNKNSHSSAQPNQEHQLSEVRAVFLDRRWITLAVPSAPGAFQAPGKRGPAPFKKPRGLPNS